MSNLNRLSDPLARTLVRRVSRFGGLCTLLAAVGLSMGLMNLQGCPIGGGPPCEADADCEDNGNFCDGAEVCGANGRCTSAGIPCDAEETCNEEEDRCDVCMADADCDDGLFCTGVETCVDGQCVTGTPACPDDGEFCNGAEGPENCDEENDVCDPPEDPCEADEACDEENNVCQNPCTDGADCNDDLFCNGIETCVDGFCLVGTDACPDDGEFCNGTESCDEDNDVCESSGDPCAADEVCNEETDACDMGTPCDTDADCVDDLFCNGEESCNDDGLCESTGDPCTALQTCNEDLNTCEDPEGDNIFFTLAVDDLDGTGGNDTFSAPLEFNAPTGASLPTFQNSDSANAGDGNDVLNATTNFTANTTVTATLNSLEVLNFMDLGTAVTTINGSNFSGVASVNNRTSSNTNALVVNNLEDLVGIGLFDTQGGLNVGLRTAATSGTSDSMNATFSNVTTTEGTCGGGTFAGAACESNSDCLGGVCNNAVAAVVTIATGTTNGVETLDVESTGSANRLGRIQQATGTSMTTVNVSGDQSLSVATTLDNSVTTVASTNSQGVRVLVGNGNVTFTGGDGDDWVAFPGANFTSQDSVDGGGGTNTLSLLSADADNSTAALTNVSNIQQLEVFDALGAAVNATHYGSIGRVFLPAGSNGGSLTVESGTDIQFGRRGGNVDSAGTLGVTVGGSGSTDSVMLTVNDSDFTGAVTFTGVETANLVSNVDEDGSAADGGTNAFVAFTLPDSPGVSLNVSGSEDVTFLAAVTARQIAAGGFDHALLMTLNTAGNTTTSTVASGGTTITSGSGNDILVGSTSTDSLNSGTGNDVIQPGRDVDTCDLGTGSDILDLEDLATAQLTSANRVTCSGMTIDGTDFNTTNEVDAVRFGNVTTDGDLSDGATAAEIQAETTAGNKTFNGTAGVLELAFEFSSSANLGAGGATELNGTTLLSACGATSGTTACTITMSADAEDGLIIAYQGGNAYIYFANESADADAGAVDAGEIALVAVINGGVSVGGFVASNFVN